MDSGGEEPRRWAGKRQRSALPRPRDTEESTACNTDRLNPPIAQNAEDDDPYKIADGGDTSGSLGSSGSSRQLSPYAEIFVPRNQASFVLSPHAKEFTPSGAVNEYSSTNNEEADFAPEYSPFEEIMQQLIYEVTVNPASFESEVANFTLSLNDMVYDDVLQSVAEIIVKQGIMEPNFRYNAVRMCKYLSDHLPAESKMRHHVLTACKDVFDKSDEYMLTPEGQNTLRGYSLFLAEIYSQMLAGNKRLVFIGDSIYSILEKLLSDASKDNLKCVCQVIKFVGVHLEDDERSRNDLHEAPTMDRIVTRIDECAVAGSVDRSIAGMLRSVVELRNSNFGRGDLSPSISSNSQSDDSDGTSDPIRYGPDGQKLTAEEASFVDSIYNDVPNGDEFAYEENYENEEMTDEMYTAFEQFLSGTRH